MEFLLCGGLDDICRVDYLEVEYIDSCCRIRTGVLLDGFIP